MVTRTRGIHLPETHKIFVNRTPLAHDTRPADVPANLDVFPPLIRAVALGDLWLEQMVAGHGWGQSGQRLPAAASHTHQQRAATRHKQDAADARQMLQHVPGPQRHQDWVSRSYSLSFTHTHTQIPEQIWGKEKERERDREGEKEKKRREEGAREREDYKKWKAMRKTKKKSNKWR